MNTADFHSIALLEATREHIEQAGALLAQTQLIVDTMSCGQWKGDAARAALSAINDLSMVLEVDSAQSLNACASVEAEILVLSLGSAA